jgi:hypothetical protein
VHRLAYSGDSAAGQLAVFQGASEAPISELIRAERATRKNSQLAAARRVALKMGRHGHVRRSLGEGGGRPSLPLGQVLLSMRIALRAIWRYALPIYHPIELLDRIAYTNAGFNLHC